MKGNNTLLTVARKELCSCFIMLLSNYTFILPLLHRKTVFKKSLQILAKYKQLCSPHHYCQNKKDEEKWRQISSCAATWKLQPVLQPGRLWHQNAWSCAWCHNNVIWAKPHETAENPTRQSKPIPCRNQFMQEPKNISFIDFECMFIECGSSTF